MPAPGEVTLGGVAEEGWQKIRDAGYRAEIRELERKGGAEASRRLLELAREPKASYKITVEAIHAIGRLGRREDVSGLMQYSGWNRDGIPSGLSWTTDALADIGGPEACAALTELLRDRLPGLARRNYLSDVDIGHLATAVERAECLNQEDLRSVLWTHGSDLWVAENVQQGALRFLADRGDAKASSRVVEYAELLAISDADYLAVEELVVRSDLPWWLRARVMSGYNYSGYGGYVAALLPRERLFDTHFRVLLSVYAAAPPEEEQRRGELGRWTDRIAWNPRASWDGGQPAAYFAQKREEYQATLPADLYARVSPWIDDAEAKNAYHEVRRRRDAGEQLPLPNVPELPKW